MAKGIKIFVLTSTKYVFLLPEFAERFEKYWGEPFSIWVSNTELGKWSDGVLRFLDYIRDDYFILLHEDFYLTQPVNKSLIAKLWDTRLGHDRVSLLGNHTPARTMKNGEFYVHKPNAEYQFSFEASIQSGAFLARNLVPGLDPWEAERRIAGSARGNVLSSEHPAIWYQDKSRRLVIQQLQ